MPRAKLSKKQPNTAGKSPAYIEPNPQPEPELNEDLMNERLEALNMRYREKVLQDFLNENKSPELDKIIENNKMVSAIEDEVFKASDVLEQETQKYLETGKNMDNLFVLRKNIENIEDKLSTIPPLPKECKELYKEYKRVLNVKGF